MAKRTTNAAACICFLLATACRQAERPKSGTVAFAGGKHELRGLPYKPDGPGPFFQAENDLDTDPSRVLFAERKAAGRPAELRIYPAFGNSERDGHSLPYRGVKIWRDDVMAFLDRHCLR